MLPVTQETLWFFKERNLEMLSRNRYSVSSPENEDRRDLDLELGDLGDVFSTWKLGENSSIEKREISTPEPHVSTFI